MKLTALFMFAMATGCVGLETDAEDVTEVTEFEVSAPPAEIAIQPETGILPTCYFNLVSDPTPGVLTCCYEWRCFVCNDGYCGANYPLAPPAP